MIHSIFGVFLKFYRNDLTLGNFCCWLFSLHIMFLVFRFSHVDTCDSCSLLLDISCIPRYSHTGGIPIVASVLLWTFKEQASPRETWTFLYTSLWKA